MLFAAARLVLLAVIRDVYFLIFKADQRGMLVVLVRLVIFGIRLLIPIVLNIKRKLFLALVVMLRRRWHQNVFQP